MKSENVLFGLFICVFGVLLILSGCSDKTDLTNCEVATDGCNKCMVSDGKIGGCTKMACGSDYLEKPECIKYKK